MATQPIKPPQKPNAAQSAFGELSPALARELETISLTNHYPTGAVLFSEGQPPRGIYIVQRGLVKMSVCASDGRTPYPAHRARDGDALGAASTIGNRDYEATAEAQQPCDITFIRQSDVLRMMRVHGEFALWITQLLSRDYNFTCREIRTLMLSGSASEKLARLLVGCRREAGPAQHRPHEGSPHHEEIGQMIGTSRETVTRLMAGFRKQRLIEQEGATLVVSNRVALESLITA
jgi:CRP/FNR family transcriptional regulator